MNRDVMFSSATDQWETPQPLFDKLDQVYHFETDVCALPENAKCKHYFYPGIGRFEAGMERPLLDEPALWKANRGMGAQSV